jgi:hypothetical protein
MKPKCYAKYDRCCPKLCPIIEDCKADFKYLQPGKGFKPSAFDPPDFTLDASQEIGSEQYDWENPWEATDEKGD